MFVAAVMVTEGRVQIAGVALTSFMTQTHSPASLRIYCPDAEVQKYRQAAAQAGLFNFGNTPNHRTGDVSRDLDVACEDLFLNTSADVCCVWDDDDYSPPDRLERTVSAISAFHPRPVVTSYDRGYFVNARSLNGSLVKVPHLWGGCLAFNREAFFKAGGFDGRPFPGQDRSFATAAERSGAKVVRIEAPDHLLPIAFIHGKNVATLPQAGARPMEERLREWLPDVVFAEVKRFQQYCVERRIFPPEGGV